MNEPTEEVTHDPTGISLKKQQPSGRTLLEMHFWRIAPTVNDIPKKRVELIRDVEYWLRKVKHGYEA